MRALRVNTAKLYVSLPRNLQKFHNFLKIKLIEFVLEGKITYKTNKRRSEEREGSVTKDPPAVIVFTYARQRDEKLLQLSRNWLE